MTRLDRDRLIRSVVASQELAGVRVTYREAESLLADILKEPLLRIDNRDR